jgi:hypothetical protein
MPERPDGYGSLQVSNDGEVVAGRPGALLGAVTNLDGNRGNGESMPMRTKSEDALDLLESEDLQLRALFTRLQQSQGESVEERATYGDLAKEIVRHVAIREAAVADVVRSVGTEPQLASMSTSLERPMGVRRLMINEVEKKSRGIQGISLNTGQDFRGPLMELVQQVGPEIEWDLDEVVPAIRGSLGEEPESHRRG